ncbi:hypothetical protein K438DRAFT_1853671 [Mycena galopus ATCC 62051]|nr:hypothetical protein K438DRAFT_1853671 [Mycena galopus ATCC 62051]
MDPLARARLELIGLSSSPHHVVPPPPQRAVPSNPSQRTRHSATRNLQVNLSRVSGPQSSRLQVDESSQLARARLGLIGLSASHRAFPQPPGAVDGKLSPPQRTGVPTRPHAGTPPSPLRRTGVIARTQAAMPPHPILSSQPSPPVRPGVSTRPQAGAPPRSILRSRPSPPSRTSVPRNPQTDTPLRSMSISPPCVPSRLISSDLLIFSSSALEELEKVEPRTSEHERSGLCVICQDEEANMVVVDCGHLAMCKECSAGVMSSSRACPLCRTSIAEARLIRIFKT